MLLFLTDSKVSKLVVEIKDKFKPSRCETHAHTHTHTERERERLVKIHSFITYKGEAFPFLLIHLFKQGSAVLS